MNFKCSQSGEPTIGPTKLSNNLSGVDTSQGDVLKMTVANHAVIVDWKSTAMIFNDH